MIKKEKDPKATTVVTKPVINTPVVSTKPKTNLTKPPVEKI